MLGFEIGYTKRGMVRLDTIQLLDTGEIAINWLKVGAEVEPNFVTALMTPT